MKDNNRKTPCAWCKRLWRAFDAVPAGNSRASSGFSACHIIPLSGCIHRKAINRKKLFPAGTALWIHQVQSRSDWAAVRRSRWRIHRATIERFISVYRLEENGSLLKEGTGDAVGWALRACSYKTKTEASQQRRSRHTLQGVFLVFLCCIPSKWTIIFDDLSHFAIFLSLLEHETPCKCPFGHLLSHIKQQTIGSNFY